jgi:hypothetical protein
VLSTATRDNIREAEGGSRESLVFSGSDQILRINQAESLAISAKKIKLHYLESCDNNNTAQSS